jgi:hypothetical protein
MFEVITTTPGSMRCDPGFSPRVCVFSRIGAADVRAVLRTTTESKDLERLEEQTISIKAPGYY